MVKLLFAETLNKYDFPYQNYYLVLKELFEKIVSFDVRWNYYVYGKKRMNEIFLEFVKKEKPEYLFMFIGSDLIELDTLLKIKKISPKTIIFNLFGDENTAFESFSRYIILFLDYGLISPKKYLSYYYKDGIKNVFFITGVNINFFKPFKTRKKYDVTFIGRPKADRYNFIKFLKNNRVNVRVFGGGWEQFPDIKSIYGGALEADKLVEVINQSKINLSFSKSDDGSLHPTGRVYESGACNSFVLTEHCEDYLEFFKEMENYVSFKNKQELLHKINYFLKQEEQREKIALSAYKKILHQCNLNQDLKNIFKKIKPGKIKKINLPKIKQKIFLCSKVDLELPPTNLKLKLKKYNYVIFFKKNNQDLRFRRYLQSYSLHKTKKSVSCCDCYVHSPILGDYLRFAPESAFKILNQDEFISLIDLSQIMVTKEFLLENVELFRNFFNNQKINFIKKENTTFIVFPLVRIRDFPNVSYNLIKQIADLKFLFQLFSLFKTRKIFFSLYPYSLLLRSFKHRFILPAIFNLFKNEDKINKLKTFKKIT